MIKSLASKVLFFVVSLGVFAVSCSDSGTGIEDSESVTFKGRVENTSSPTMAAREVEDALVIAAMVTPSGSLQTIGKAKTRTNAEGAYTLRVNQSAIADSAKHIVIAAGKGNQTAKAFVAAEIESGKTIQVQPISFESSAEAMVYQNIVANGDAGMVTKASIEVMVGNETAANIERNTQYAADVASALAASAVAEDSLYVKKGIEVSPEQRQTIVQAKQEAMVQLAAQLNAAANNEAERAAFQTFIQTMANAELDAGIEAWALTQVNDLSARIFVQNSSDLSVGAQSEIRKYAYYFTAVSLQAAVKAQAKALGASDSTLNAIAQSSTALQTNILNTIEASEEQIEMFFAHFNESVQAAVISDDSLNSAAFVITNAAISGSSGLKGNFEAALSETTIDLNAKLKAYAAFYSGINALVQTNFTEIDPEKVQAYTRLLLLINLST